MALATVNIDKIIKVTSASSYVLAVDPPKKDWSKKTYFWHDIVTSLLFYCIDILKYTVNFLQCCVQV